jgi:hypothetical protein
VRTIDVYCHPVWFTYNWTHRFEGLLRDAHGAWSPEYSGATPITITSLYRHNGTLATRFSAQKQRIPQINCLPGCGYACIIKEHRGIHGLRLTGQHHIAHGPATTLWTALAIHYK